MSIRTCAIVVLLGISGATVKLKAQVMSLRKQQQTPGVSAMKDPEKDSKAHVYGHIRMEGMQYFTPIPDAPRLTYSQLLSARLSMLKETGWFDLAGDVSAGTFFSRGQTHAIVHEAYLASRSTTLKAYAGRKKNDWSELDRRWQLALWQPSFSIDALRPDEQGLTGIFLDYDTKNFEVLGFVSPLFIPSMGPEVREEGGGLVADSRWYRAPSRDYDFNSRINTIQYDLEIPEATRLANNGSIAVMARAGNKEQGPWVVMSVGYVPVNELILSRKAFKDISQPKVDVTVSPDVTHHTLQSVDMGYTYKRLKLILSYLEDNPVVKLPDVDWSIQKLLPLRAYSATADFTIDNILTRTLAFQMSYLKVEGGGIQDIVEDGSPDDFTLFDHRVKFTNAVSFRLEGQIARFFRRPFVSRFKYLYDYDQRGSLLNAEFLYYPDQKWALVMGGDVLGVQDEHHMTSGFLNQYRANDRFYGGMTYVF